MTKFLSFILLTMCFAFSANAAAKKVLVSYDYSSMLGPNDYETISLMEDGTFMKKVGKKKAKRIAKLQDQASLDEVVEAIQQIPNNAKVKESTVMGMCASDSGSSMSIYGEQFTDGRKVIQSNWGCGETSVINSKAAKKIVRMMESVIAIAYK